jgi:acyl phosphate:glycerol-3-phosphate acyltransferase
MSWIEYLHSADWNQAGAICLFAYLLGCFTSGYYLVRLIARKDIREMGSGSVGARNVSRALGLPGFCMTVSLDFAKGALAVWTARQFFPADDTMVALGMLAVVVGHIWPAQLRFHGGKGMATCLGALLVYDPLLAATFTVLFACLAATFRKATLPAMLALVCLPVASLLLDRNPHIPAKVALVSILVGLVLLAHRKNLAGEFAQFLARRHLEDPKPDHSQL